MKLTRTFAILFGALAATGILWAASRQEKQSAGGESNWTSLNGEISRIQSSQAAQDNEGPPPKVGGFIKPSYRSEGWSDLKAEILKLQSSQGTQDNECPPVKVSGFIRTSFRYSTDADGLFGAAFVSADQAEFNEVAPGASMAVLSGDPETGAYRVFTKFAPGASFPLHTHTNGMQIVVIHGAYLYKPEKGEEKRVGPGCYLFIPAGDRHASGGDPKEGALFFQESSGKFDLVQIAQDKK